MSAAELVRCGCGASLVCRTDDDGVRYVCPVCGATWALDEYGDEVEVAACCEMA